MILNKENVAHTHHGILCNHKKDEFMSFVWTWMKLETHYSQQTDTRTENQALHVLTHRQVLNSENTQTQGVEHHTLRSVERELGRNSREVGEG